MKLKFILLIAVCFLSIHLWGQTIEYLQWNFERDTIKMKFKLKGVDTYRYYSVTPYFVFGSDTVKMDRLYLSGDTGIVTDTKEKTVCWSVFEQIPYTLFMRNENKNYIVILDDYVVLAPIPKRYFLCWNGSGSTAAGVTFGYFSRWGMYGRVKSNASFSQSNLIYTDGYVTNYPGTGYYIIDGEVKRSRFSITAGVNRRISEGFYCSAGLGYGFRNLLWHYNDYEYDKGEATGNALVIDTGKSFNGIETELELHKAKGPFLFSLGLNILTDIKYNKSFKNKLFFEPNFGIGYIFNAKKE